jgi:four helix bundle protein
MMRAALSVVLNLQEGAAKLSEKDRRRFYNIAYGSVKEVQAVLRLLDLQEQFMLAD